MGVIPCYMCSSSISYKITSACCECCSTWVDRHTFACPLTHQRNTIRLFCLTFASHKNQQTPIMAPLRPTRTNWLGQPPMGGPKSSHLKWTTKAFSLGFFFSLAACWLAVSFRKIESPITWALSSGFSVGASLSGENLFDVLIGTEEQCFDPWLGRLTVTQVPCCTGSTGTEQSTGIPELVASKAVSTALTFLLSLTKVWMRVYSS